MAPIDHATPRASNPARILIVDDHADTASILVRALQRAGFAVETAANCDAALYASSITPFDLFLCDIGLPDCDGWELIGRLRLQRPTKAIAVSGYGTDADVQRSLDAGFLAHLTKPLDLRRLIDTIRQALDGDGNERLLSDHVPAIE